MCYILFAHPGNVLRQFVIGFRIRCGFSHFFWSSEQLSMALQVYLRLWRFKCGIWSSFAIYADLSRAAFFLGGLHERMHGYFRNIRIFLYFSLLFFYTDPVLKVRFYFPPKMWRIFLDPLPPIWIFIYCSLFEMTAICDFSLSILSI